MIANTTLSLFVKFITSTCLSLCVCVYPSIPPSTHPPTHQPTHAYSVINFGYGFNELDADMTSSTVLVTAAGIELVFEGIVDALALDVESQNGVDLDLFWEMWRRNPLAFWGVAVTNGLLGILASMWAFRQVPTIAFCTSATDPCSCQGGGFQLFKAFCNATAAFDNSNGTSAENGTSVASISNAAKTEYKGILEALGVDAALIIISVGVGILVVVVFAVARIVLQLVNANDEKAKAEQRAKELLEKNVEIRKRLELEW